MMTLPSSSQLISVIRAELADTLGGVSDDPRVVNCLGMVDSMLASIAVRCDSEIGWMLSEIEGIADLADGMVSDGCDDGRIAGGLARLRSTDRTGFDTESVRARYQQASAVLADCAELALGSGGDAQRRVEAVLAVRLDHERQVRGALELVGRG